jgi:hypothetical protein
LTEPPPAADPARRSRSSRGDDAARRRAKARWRVAIAVVVVALLVIGGVLLLGGDLPVIDGGPDGPGAFAFELGNVTASPTSDTPPSELRDVASEAGTGIKETIDELYFRAFVDTGSWGDYEAAYELFDGRAATRAEADAEVLTLGPTANDTYDRLEDASGSLTIAVLTDRQDVPATAIAEVRFEATAEAGGGRATQIESVGTFFLREVDGAWRIFAYRVDRSDETVAGSSPTGAPS